MAQVSEVVLKYAANGAQKVERADQNVRDSVQETAQTARKEQGTVKRWMQQHKSALLAIGAATTAVMAAVIQASPALSSQLAEIRFGFSLLAMEIGQDVAPTTRGLADTVIQLSDAYGKLPDPVRSITSHLVFFGGLLTALAVGAGALETVLSGTFVATLGGKAIGAIQAAGSAIAGSTTAIFGLAVAAGAALGVFGVWILKITGVLGAVRSMGSAVGSFVGGEGSAFLLFLGTVLTGGVLPLMAALGGFITGTLEGGLPEGVRRAKEALGIFGTAFKIVRRTVGRAIGGVADKFDGMVGDATRWGGDLMDNFIDGIYDRIKNLESLASDVIAKVEDKLGFDLEKNDRMARRWGRDLITEFTKGVESRSPKLRAQVSQTRQGGFGLSGAGSVMSRRGPAARGSSSGEQRIVFERGAINMGAGSGDSEQDIQAIIEAVIARLGGDFSGRSKV